MAYFTRDETAIIRAHRLEATCYVLAETGDCLQWKASEVNAVTGRRLVAVTSRSLPAKTPKSWMLAVLLCPGDDTQGVGAWAARLRPEDLHRIVFYEAGLFADLRSTYAGWTSGVASDPNRFPVDGFAHLNRLLGVDLNRRILWDHRSLAP